MEYKITQLEHSEVEIEVTLPVSEFEPHVKRAGTLISEEVEIEGFRKGKAPYDVVKKHVGESAIYERAAEVAIRKVWSNLFDQMVGKKELSQANPLIGKPDVSVTKLAPGNEFRFKIKSAVLPAISLPDYQSIAREALKGKMVPSVEEKEIEDALKWIADSRVKLVTVSRQSANGDRIEVDYEIKENGVPIKNGASKNHPFILGEGKFLPGFEEHVLGMKMGDAKEFAVAIPKDWREKTIAGKSFDFMVTMKLVQERDVPEITEEFARTLGNFESLDALKKNIREGIEAEKKDKEDQRIKTVIAEKIAKKTEIDVPEALVTSELEKMREELVSNISQFGMSWPDYLSHIKKNEADLKKDWRDEAVKRVRVALCLREIAKKEDIVVSEEEIKEKADQYLTRFGAENEAKAAIDPDLLKEYARNVVRNEKVFEMLVR